MAARLRGSGCMVPILGRFCSPDRRAHGAMPLLDLQTTGDGHHVPEQVVLLLGHHPGAEDGETCRGRMRRDAANWVEVACLGCDVSLSPLQHPNNSENQGLQHEKESSG
jgi:hypothetical protein